MDYGKIKVKGGGQDNSSMSKRVLQARSLVEIVTTRAREQPLP